MQARSLRRYWTAAASSKHFCQHVRFSNTHKEEVPMRFTALLTALLVAAGAQAQQVEKRDVHIAVGGKSALYYLPLVLTERLGYFKDEGLTGLKVSDFAGGTRSLEAVVGGSADVVSGSYE